MNSECSDECCCTPEEEQLPTNIRRRIIRKHFADQPRKALILKRVAPDYTNDESELFGKLTAKKLRRVSQRDRDLLMMQINQMLLVRLYSIKTHQDKATQTAPVPPPQIQAKKLYRVNAVPNINMPPNTTPASAPIPPANNPESEVSTSKETPENKTKAGYFCSVM